MRDFHAKVQSGPQWVRRATGELPAAAQPWGAVVSGADAKSWYVYVAQCADGSLYTGVAKDVSARLQQHNSGRGARYARGRQPLTLVYQEAAGAQGDALRREAEIKRLPRHDKDTLIAAGRRRPPDG